MFLTHLSALLHVTGSLLANKDHKSNISLRSGQSENSSETLKMIKFYDRYIYVHSIELGELYIYNDIKTLVYVYKKNLFICTFLALEISFKGEYEDYTWVYGLQPLDYPLL